MCALRFLEKVFLIVEKLIFWPIFGVFFLQKCQFFHSTPRWHHVFAETAYIPSEWILHTLPHTMQSIEDHVIIVTLLVILI